MTVYAVFVSDFLTTLNNFLALSEVWLAPYAGVFVAYLTISRRTANDASTAVAPGVPRVNYAGVIAIVTGGLAAFLCAETTYWHGPISTAIGGADLSPYVGTIFGAVTYAVAYRLLASRAEAIDSRLRRTRKGDDRPDQMNLRTLRKSLQ